ncbi:hypothetical protein VV01_12995 [Luteipulveratus halotolerans]|uniref:Zeta toxin domain-containing protein n=2 Tax=Luteipulveratus halotolerans TaxID=1631356 RepID=A0A0L6CNX6_9MICO|nr:hypothetical protein VV01_12995 [Luteipulveratus halotolerans]
MTVGRAVCARSGFRLFHNHHTIEPLIEVFDHGTPPFNLLNAEFRRRVIEEAAASGTRLVFTYAFAVDLVEDVAEVERLIAPYADAGLPVSAVELQADLDTRLARNRGADRIAAKPSKRDLAWSDDHVRSTHATYRMHTAPDDPSAADALLARMPHLRLDNTSLSPQAAAGAILDWLPTTR